MHRAAGNCCGSSWMMLALAVVVVGAGAWAGAEPEDRGDGADDRPAATAEPAGHATDGQARGPRKTLARVTLDAPDDAAIDLEKLLRPRVTGTSIVIYNNEPNAAYDGTSLVIQTPMRLSGEAPRLLDVSYVGRTTKIIGSDGEAIRFVPNKHAATGRATWLPFQPTVEQRLGRQGSMMNGVPGSLWVSLPDRAGPTLAQVRGEVAALVATRLETVDVPLPSEAFDEKIHARPADKAFETIALPDGSTLRLVKYEPHFGHDLTYTFSTPDAARFRWPGKLVDPEKGLPVAFVAPLFLKNGKRLARGSSIPDRIIPSDPDAPDAADDAAATGRLRVSPYGKLDAKPDTVRFIIARDVRVVPMTLTIYELPLNTIVNASAKADQ